MFVEWINYTLYCNEKKRLFISLCKSLHNLSPCYLSDLIIIFSQVHSPLAIPVSLLFLEYAKYTFMSRSLHLLVSLPGIFFPYCLNSFRFWLQCYLIITVFPSYPIKILSLSLIFPYSIYHLTDIYYSYVFSSLSSPTRI